MPRYYRKVIRIRAEDSPNVRLGLLQRKLGIEPTGEMLVPGVLPWADYLKRRATWDQVRQCVGLDAEFWEGAEVLMYPPDWLNNSERIAYELQGKPRKAVALGVDSGEGSANTSFAVVDELGLVKLVSHRTKDTNVIVGESLAIARELGVADENILFDRGGGGKQHADRLRAEGHPVRTVPFGGAVELELKRGTYPIEERKAIREERYQYTNRRAQMYGELRLRIEAGFGIPCDGLQYAELRRQLSLIPMLYDKEGRIRMLPKNKTAAHERSLTDLLGCSPDEADSLVLAVHGMLHRGSAFVAGGF